MAINGDTVVERGVTRNEAPLPIVLVKARGLVVKPKYRE